MLAAAILKAMKDKQKDQGNTNSPDNVYFGSDDGNNSIVKDISLNSDFRDLPDDIHKESHAKGKEGFQQSGFSGTLPTDQNTRTETTEHTLEPNTASNNIFSDFISSPSISKAIGQVISSQKEQPEKGELRGRPKDLVAIFKRNSELYSEGSSQTNSPKLKGSPLKRNAVATMKRVREKIQVANLFMNMSRKSTESSNQQVIFSDKTKCLFIKLSIRSGILRWVLEFHGRLKKS